MRKIFNTFSVLAIVAIVLASCETGRNGLNTEGSGTEFLGYWDFNDGYYLFFSVDPLRLVPDNFTAEQYSSAEELRIITNYFYNIIAEEEGFLEVIKMENDYINMTPDRISKLPLDQELKHGKLQLLEYGTGNDKVFMIRYSIPSYIEISEGKRTRGIIDLKVWSFQESALVRVGGPNQTSIFSGSAKYNGFVGMNPRTTFSPDNFHSGTFSMSANFDKKTGSIDATIGKLARLKGDFSINTEIGSFNGDDLVLTSESGSSKASISGFFHGDLSKGISGVFYLETDSADGKINNHVGTMVGSMEN